MIFFTIALLGLWAKAEVPASDKKVIDYIVEQEREKPKNTPEALNITKGTDEPDKVPQTISEMKSGRTTADEQAPSPESILAKPWQWIVLFILLVLGGVSWFIPKKKEKVGNMRIQSRSFFGQEGSLAVVEILDAQNNPRLFLLGLHNKGAPQFLADLSAPVPFPDIFDQKAEQRQTKPPVPKKTTIPKSRPIPKTIKSEHKEALVEQVLRVRERKVEEVTAAEVTSNPKPKKVNHSDPWTEGFNEILRK